MRRVLLQPHKLALMALCCALALSTEVAQASVSIASFQAEWQGTQVKVTWITGTETDNAGFNLYRSTTANGTFTKLNATLIQSQCLGCINGATYTYNDSNVSATQSYFYKLQAVDFSGAQQDYAQLASVTASAPTATATPVNTPTLPPTASPTRTLPPTATFTAPPPTATPSRTPSPARSSAMPTLVPPTATTESTSTASQPTATSTAMPAMTQAVQVVASDQTRTPDRSNRSSSPARPSADDTPPLPALILALLLMGGLGAVTLLGVTTLAFWRARRSH